MLSFGYGKQRDTFHEMDQYFVNGFTKVLNPYHFLSPNQIKVSNGRILADKSEGYVMFPRRRTVVYTDYYRNEYLAGTKDSIMITTKLDGENLIPKYIPIGYGFLDAFCTDVDGDNQDEIVKLNSIATFHQYLNSFPDAIVRDSIVVTVLKANSVGSLDTVRYGGFCLYKDTSVNTKSAGYYDTSDLWPVVPKIIVQGDYLGNKKKQLMVIRSSFSSGVPNMKLPMHGQASLIDLDSMKLKVLSNNFSYTSPVTRLARYDAIFSTNINGDSKNDLCRVDSLGTHFYEVIGDSLHLIRTIPQIKWDQASYNRTLLQGDFNGDGFVDFMSVPVFCDPNQSCTGEESEDLSYNASLMCSTTADSINDDTHLHNIKLYLNTTITDGNANILMDTLTNWIHCQITNATNFFTSDIDGDGKSDLVESRSECDNNVSTFRVHYLTEHGIGYMTQTSNTNSRAEFLISSTSKAQGKRGRLVGIGRAGTLRHYAPIKFAQTERLITEIQTPIGYGKYFTYQDIGDSVGGRIYNAIDTTQLQDDVERVYEGATVVRTAHIYAEDRQVDSINYFYKNGFVHKEGLGFLGYREFSSQSALHGEQKSIYDPFRFGIKLSYDDSKVSVSNMYSVNIDISKRRNICLLHSSTLNKALGMYQYAHNEYDNRNYKTHETVIFGDSSYRKEIFYTYLHKNFVGSHSINNPYILGLPTENEEKTFTPTDTLRMKSVQTYDDKGLCTVRVGYRNEDVPIAYAILSYNSNNRLVSHNTQNLVNNISLRENYIYDLNGRLIRNTKITAPNTSDSIVDRTTFEYNNTGALIKSYDKYNKATEYKYDSWQRLDTTKYPDGSYATTFTSLLDLPDSTVIAKTIVKTGAPKKILYLNKLGQVIYEATDTPLESNIVKNKYDDKGRLVMSTMPYKYEPTQFNRYTYDDFDRIIETSFAVYDPGCVIKTNTTRYVDNMVTTVINGERQTKTYDPMGRLITSNDSAGGVIHFLPLADGQNKTVTTPVNTITMSYDEYGRQISINNPSTVGLTSMRYNKDLRKLTTSKVAGDSVVNEYTLAGLVKRCRIYSGANLEQDVSYTYDSKGKLLLEKGNARIRSYGYDNLGRQTSFCDSIPITLLPDRKHYGKKWKYAQKWDYNSIGELKRITHYLFSNPLKKDTVIESRTYSGGALMSVRVGDPSSWHEGMEKLAWERGQENEMGYCYESHSDYVTNYTEYNDEGLINCITYYGNCRNMQEEYEYDRRNNVTRRSCDLPWRQYDERFEYDQFNRIKQHGNYEFSVVEPIAYDQDSDVPRGNISNIPNVSNTTYNGYKTNLTNVYHAKDQYPAVAIDYDAQQLPIRLVQLKPEGESKYILNYKYDHNGKKVSSILRSEWATSGTTIRDTSYVHCYFGDQYEIHYDNGCPEEYLYIGGDAYTAPVVLYRQPGVTIMLDPENSDETGLYPWEMHTLGRDIQGSITHVINELGLTQQWLAMNEWGLPTNDRRSFTSNMYFLPRTFGSHEYLAEFGLYHMNARLYDPVNGRFLSPDPYIQDLTNFQNHNPYTYCLNNPFKYSDPTGKVSHISFDQETDADFGIDNYFYLCDNVYQNFYFSPDEPESVGLPGQGDNGDGSKGYYYDWSTSTYRDTETLERTSWSDVLDMINNLPAYGFWAFDDLMTSFRDNSLTSLNEPVTPLPFIPIANPMADLSIQSVKPQHPKAIDATNPKGGFYMQYEAHYTNKYRTAGFLILYDAAGRQVTSWKAFSGASNRKAYTIPEGAWKAYYVNQAYSEKFARDGVSFRVYLGPDRYDPFRDRETQYIRVHPAYGGTLGCIGLDENREKLLQFQEFITDYINNFGSININVIYK